MKLSKYTALGNDYLFINSSLNDLPSPGLVKKLCNRYFGIGADGVLFGSQQDGKFLLTIYNSDGSVAETSGNGSRIFARAMLDDKQIGLHQNFIIETQHRQLECQIVDINTVELNIGLPQFIDKNIPNPWEKTTACADQNFKYHAVSVGNPHCVIFTDTLIASVVKQYGPLLEKLPEFPQKTNVQFAKIINTNTINIEIWERGSGYTLSSGSSCCAVFAVARKLNLCDTSAVLNMPGGQMALTELASGEIIQLGQVYKIADCELSDDFMKF